MTETEQTGDGVTDEQRKADDEARRLIRLQIQEGELHEDEKARQNLSSLSNSAFRATVRRSWGFDPGV